MIAGDESARRLHGRLGWGRGGGDNDRDTDQEAGSHRRELYRPARGPSILTLSGASAMLACVISVGVQTWGTDLGFADLPATRMVEVFAERVLPFLASRR